MSDVWYSHGWKERLHPQYLDKMYLAREQLKICSVSLVIVTQVFSTRNDSHQSVRCNNYSSLGKCKTPTKLLLWFVTQSTRLQFKNQNFTQSFPPSVDFRCSHKVVTGTRQSSAPARDLAKGRRKKSKKKKRIKLAYSRCCWGDLR